MCTISVTHLATAGVSLLAVFVGRAANIFPGAYLLNSTTRPTDELGRFDQNLQLTLWYCGLRGAVAYALAMKAAATMGSAGEAMLSCTLFVVMFTVILMGGSTSWVLKQLGIIDTSPRWIKDPDADPNASPSKTRGSPGLRGTPAAGEATPRTARATTNTSSYRALRQFDFKYLQPLLLAVPMKRLPRDDAHVDGGETVAGFVGGDREERFAGGASRRTAGRGRPGAADEERVPILGDRDGKSGGDNGAVGSRAVPENPLWDSDAV
jgi:hypothetical protein